MDTNRIRYFLSLAQTGSIARAAELHRISSPAFSKAMKVFENEVGQDLLVPHGRGVMLTDAAQLLVPELKNIISRIDQLVAGAHSRSTEAKQVLKIASFEVFSTYFMEKGFESVFKTLSCQLFEMIPGEIENAVAQGHVDLGLTYNPIPRPELDFLKVQSIAMGVYGLKNFRGADFSQIPFVVPLAQIEGSPSKVKGLDGWPDDKIMRNIVYRVSLLESALGICRRGLACAYLPKFLVKIHNEVVRPEFALVEVQSPRVVSKDFIYLVKRKSDIEGDMAKKIGAFIRKTCSIE